MTINLEYYERQMSQWEVSSFDIVQSETYKAWAERHVKNMKTEVVDSIANDVHNMHFAFVRPPKNVLNQILTELGMDIMEQCERQMCLHKTFGGYMINGERYVGLQRTDVEWRNFIKRVSGL